MMIKEFDDDDDDMQRPLTLPHTTKTNVLITLPCLLQILYKFIIATIFQQSIIVCRDRVDLSVCWVSLVQYSNCGCVYVCALDKSHMHIDHPHKNHLLSVDISINHSISNSAAIDFPREYLFMNRLPIFVQIVCIYTIYRIIKQTRSSQWKGVDGRI